MNYFWQFTHWFYWKLHCTFLPHRYLPCSSPPYKVFESRCQCGHLNPHPETDKVLSQMLANREKQIVYEPFVWIACEMQCERLPKTVEAFWGDHWACASKEDQEIMWSIYRDIQVQSQNALEYAKSALQP